MATLDAHHLMLTRKEYELLSLLVQNAGEIVPREVLFSRVWGYGDQFQTRTLDVHIRRLRSKLGAHSQQYLETIVGVGYRFQPFRSDRPFSPILAALVESPRLFEGRTISSVLDA
jgi:DNA-binding response OmpR family regulator